MQATFGGVLVAGLGGLEGGDEAFGSEVARQLSSGALPQGVRVCLLGSRSHNLAFALEEYGAVILVEALGRQQPPGTLYLIELDPEELSDLKAGTFEAHRLDAVCALQMGRCFGQGPGRLFLVGCEPTPRQGPSSSPGLSAPVRLAVPRAVEQLQALIEELLAEHDRPVREPLRAPAELLSPPVEATCAIAAPAH